MADTRISELTELAGASVANDDEFVVVDKSDTTMAASGTDKKVTAASLAAVPALVAAFDAAGAASSAVTTHASATDPHGDRAYTDAQIAAAGGASVPAYQFGPSLSGTRYARNPGMGASALGTYAVTANQTYYWPIEVLSDIQFDAFQLEVTAGAAGTVRMGLYPAGTDWMPSATLVKGSGSIDTSTTGVKTDSFTAVSVPAGRYCLAFNASNSITCRRIAYASQVWGGGNALVTWFHVFTGSHGAMPSTPAAPTVIASDTATYCWGFMRCTP